MPNFESVPEIGNIKLEDHLPEAFKNPEVRDATAQSLEGFKTEHGGELPLKFRIEEFCFKRDEQICTADTERKYLAWAGDDSETQRNVFDKLADSDAPVVLRSHPMSYGMASPVLQVTQPEQIGNHRRFLAGDDSSSDLQRGFFEKIDAKNTVVQLIKNAYPQEGLFLVRPTFVYDHTFQRELREYRDPSPQYMTGGVINLGEMPSEFTGLRVVVIDKFAREKKVRLGAMFIYNPETGKLEARGGFPYEAKLQMTGAWKDKERAPLMGRTLDLSDGSTLLHHRDGRRRLTSDSIFLWPQDTKYLEKVLEWQMPRIARFESEIRAQDWIPQGYATSHQFIVFPPQKLGKHEINTQYFDFRAHESRKEMDDLADGKFGELPTEEKILKFF